MDHMSIEELIELCQPGKYFLGLWTVRVKKPHHHELLWTVTFIDKNNTYGETNCYKEPKRALEACAKFLKVLPATRPVRINRDRKA